MAPSSSPITPITGWLCLITIFILLGLFTGGPYDADADVPRTRCLCLSVLGLGLLLVFIIVILVRVLTHVDNPE